MKTYEEITKSKKIWGIIPLCHMPHTTLYKAWIKLPDSGTASVVWCDNENEMEHVSVSPKHKFNIPSWNDMCFLKDTFFNDDEEVYQIHPKKSEYVNVTENCLHLWKPIGTDIHELMVSRKLLLQQNRKSDEK